MGTSEEAHTIMVSNLNKAFKMGKTLPYEWRLAQLLAMQRMVNENVKAIEAAITTDLGLCLTKLYVYVVTIDYFLPYCHTQRNNKLSNFSFHHFLGRSFFESIAFDTLPVNMEIVHAISNLKSWMQPIFTKLPAICAPSTNEIRYEPYGVVLIMSPFNYPFLLTLNPLIGAIVAGNCATIKPSELTKCSETLMLKLISQYLDNDCFKVVTGGVATTTSLLNQKWGKILFTGSARVGKIVLEAAAKHLTPVSLELGGKSPTIIDKTVTNMELVAKRIMWGKLANSGQVCVMRNPFNLFDHDRKLKSYHCSNIAINNVYTSLHLK